MSEFQYYYAVIAFATFLGLILGLFGHAVWNRDPPSRDDWMWLLAFALFGGLVWPIFFTVAGFGITLYVIGGILEFLYHAFVGLLNRSKPEKPDPKAKDSETPYR